MRSLRRVFTLSSFGAAIFLLSACSERGSLGPINPGGDGGESLLAVSWSGTADPIQLTLTLDPVPLSGDISGSGVLGSVHAAFAFSASGRVSGSVVAMDFVLVGGGAVTFVGTLTTDGRSALATC